MGIVHIHMLAIDRAMAEDRVEPDWNNMIEMPLRIGASSDRANHKGQPKFFGAIAD